MSINRIRLEFKAVWVVNNSHTICVLIESDWNLKEAMNKVTAGGVKVLIESDWNLKCFKEVDRSRKR